MGSSAGQLQHCQPTMQSDLHWTSSDGYSTSTSATPRQDTFMEEDRQPATPLSHSHQQPLSRGHGLSNSSSAPDLRLMMATDLPDVRPTYLPTPGSYAGAMVPYKGPEVGRLLQFLASGRLDGIQHQQVVWTYTWLCRAT